MKDDDLTHRVAALEQKLEELSLRLGESRPGSASDMKPSTQFHWWRDDAGRFKDDPVFDEISRLGRAYRESLHRQEARRQNFEDRIQTLEEVIAMLILDTDLLSLVQRQEGEDYERLKDRLDEASSSEKICVTIISFEEQMRGWLEYVAKAGKSAKIVVAYERLLRFEQDYRAKTVLPFDGPAFGEFRDMLRSRLRIGSMDLKITAIALSLNATLLSRNLADFRKVPMLRVEDWSR